MSDSSRSSGESLRLEEDRERHKNWKRWGPYLAERQWGTVREDYSAEGEAWDSFPFEHAHLRAYRWGEDGILGFCDRQCRLCFSLAMWNGKDPFLKERLFGLNGREGNHGEDCKELYYYLDSSPTHSYAKGLYKYPQSEFPYERLRQENARRGYHDSEYEILDTGIFDDDAYFDVFVEYAKKGPNDLLIQATIANRSDDSSAFHFLPKLFFRNTWIWGCEHEGCTLKPSIRKRDSGALELEHQTLNRFHFEADVASDGVEPIFVFSENETNTRDLYDSDNYTPYVKDAFNRWLIHGETDAVNPKEIGTIAAVYYPLNISARGEVTVRMRLYSEEERPRSSFGKPFATVFEKRKQEAGSYWNEVLKGSDSDGDRETRKQAYAGLLWSKQFYHFSVHDWLRGDPDIAQPPKKRLQGRNKAWSHLFNRDVISMPDKWEYPWYAAWDLAFHMIPFADIDPDYAKQQLILFLREWYMHPNGQIPAYEWEFGDVNPPVHAWACWEVYKLERDKGRQDLLFLKRVFQKLLLNFTWWVNRKDPDGNNIFSGGFLGLDNIGVFDRSKPLPGGGHLQQADGTAWMAFYCARMLSIALELAKFDKSYSDVASKFFEHFVGIADAMNKLGGEGLWDSEDGFYYDRIRSQSLPDGSQRMRIRSMVGIIPLFAVDLLDEAELEQLPGFRSRMNWYLEHRKDLAQQIAYMECSASGGKYLLAIPSRERLQSVLSYLFSEDEFLSPYGIRALSKYHERNPFSMTIDRERYEVGYEPGDSQSWLFGGNSNWRGPVWFPVNYLIVESLRRYYRFYGDSIKVEAPTGSGNLLNLNEAADFLSERLRSLFLPDANGSRPAHGDASLYSEDPNFKDLVLFYEYFHGDNGRGLGASHQTGWTALVASLFT